MALIIHQNDRPLATNLLARARQSHQRLFSGWQHNIRDQITGRGSPHCQPQFKALLGVAIFGYLLFSAAGCSVIEYAWPGNTQERQATLERLIAKRDYHRALIYLNKTDPERDSEAYNTQYQRIILLMEKLATDVAQRAYSRTKQNDLSGAASLVDQALKKVPESTRLLQLSAKLKQERDKRLAANERYLLISEAEYLFSRLTWYGVRASLAKPSFYMRWQQGRIEKSFRALHPDLLNCGQQASKLAEYDLAQKCLQMARKIDDSESVQQFLSRVNDIIAANNAIKEDVPLVFIAATKKSKPAAQLSSAFLELEAKLKQEIDQGKLLEAYGSLAELAKFPDKGEQLKDYRQQLDKARASTIVRQLAEGARLYRRGKISEARDRWLEVLALDPNNQIAREKTVRADKVLKNLADLQKAQGK